MKYLLNNAYVQWFSIECRKTKTKVITLTDHTRDVDNPMNQSELKANICSRRRTAGKRLQARHDWFWFYL